MPRNAADPRDFRVRRPAAIHKNMLDFDLVTRIAFAIATETEPDLTTVDEVLSVGDFLFLKMRTDDTADNRQ